MSEDQEWEMMQAAQRIVDYLFVNGQGEQAERIVLTSCDGKTLGGWSRRPVVDCILRELKANPSVKDGSK